MRFQGIFLLVIESSFFLFVFFLTFDNTQEVVAFSLGLLSHHLLALVELSAAAHVHVFCIFGHFLFHGDLFCALVTFVLLAGSLCAEGIDFRLSVGGFLLHFAEAGNLGLLLEGNAAFLLGFSGLFRSFLLIVTENFHFLIKDLLTQFSLLL